MNEQQLITFIEVARKRHFRHAAESLNLTQPAVSAQIRSLEEELGTTLFTRSQVRLTASGATFLPYAKKIVDLIQESKEAVAGSEMRPQGPLTIGITSCLSLTILPRLAKYFRTRHPELPLRLLTFDANQIAGHLSEGVIDLGIAYATGKTPAHVQTKTLFYDSFTLIASKTDPAFENRHYLTPKELEDLPLISFASTTAERLLLDSLLDRHRLRMRTIIELEGVEEIKRLVADGFGAALVPSVTVRESDQLRRIRVVHFEHSIPIVLYHPEKKYLTRAIRLLIRDISGIYPAEPD
jgi:DNA-binding transcriptional LysR family regulator